jgi:hypothetical protein
MMIKEIFAKFYMSVEEFKKINLIKLSFDFNKGLLNFNTKKSVS